ncbi:MAG: hypothetical protein Q8M03_16670 [Legionella sp.]|nr:hypothetical protein [Legionella sp.]
MESLESLQSLEQLTEKTIKKNDDWLPMARTVKIVRKWRDKIVNGELTIQNVEELEHSISKDGKYHSELQYSDKGYTQQEAMIDFTRAVCPYLSELELHHFIECVLAKEKKTLDFVSIRNTFIRNNELARYLLAYETGIHTKASEIPAVLIPAVLIDHMLPIIDKFSDMDVATIINHSIRGLLELLKKDYPGFEKLAIPDEILPDTIHDWRMSPIEDEWTLSTTSPPWPYWFSDIYQKLKPEKPPRTSIINFFNTEEDHSAAFAELEGLCNMASSLSENTF